MAERLCVDMEDPAVRPVSGVGAGPAVRTLADVDAEPAPNRLGAGPGEGARQRLGAQRQLLPLDPGPLGRQSHGDEDPEHRQGDTDLDQREA